MAHPTPTDISKYDWILDSGTTSHICTIREAFTDYKSISEEIHTLGAPTRAIGRGTVTINFSVNGSIISHQLRDTLHVPDGPNCLLSLSRFDKGGRKVEFGNQKCYLKDPNGKTVGEGSQKHRLYLLHARAQLPGQERANYAAVPKPTWDQWHRRFGHIAISSIETLNREALVTGLNIDQSSIPSHTCEACIQAKHAHKPFPQEASNRSEVPGERTMTDVWGPVKPKSIGGFNYYVSFMDDCT